MRRVRVPLAVAALIAVSLLLVPAAAPALADNPYPPGPAPTVVVKPPTPPAPVAQAARGRVAFTGANIIRWSAVALALVAIGGSLVVLDRRRARSRS